jgi:hypothetical protein
VRLERQCLRSKEKRKEEEEESKGGDERNTLDDLGQAAGCWLLLRLLPELPSFRLPCNYERCLLLPSMTIRDNFVFWHADWLRQGNNLHRT